MESSSCALNEKGQVKEPELAEFYELYREVLKYNGKEFQINGNIVKLSCDTDDVRLFSGKKLTGISKSISIEINRVNDIRDVLIMMGIPTIYILSLFNKKNKKYKTEINVIERFSYDNPGKKSIIVQLVNERDGVVEIHGISLKYLKDLLDLLNKNIIKKLKTTNKIKAKGNNYQKMAENDQKEADKLLDEVQKA